MKKICVVTGGRMEYGILYWPMKKIQTSGQFDLQLIVTGMHLVREHGFTYQAIEKDGFHINKKIEILLATDTPVGVSKAMGLGLISFAEAFDELCPDLIILLGDRFEVLAAAQAALIARIPIAHFSGGDTTQGAIDEAIRHCITKMSHLHFVTNVESEERVKQLGENPAHLFNVGSPNLDHLRYVQLLDRTALEKALNFSLRKKNIVVTYHPVTLEKQAPGQYFSDVLKAVAQLGADVGVIFTGANADTAGSEINAMIKSFVAQHANMIFVASLGQLLYHSLLNEVDVVVGNSSSGLTEAPSFKIPTVNIGDRQKGRLQSASVINVVDDQGSQVIFNAIQQAFVSDCSDAINPYGDGFSSDKIVAILESFDDFDYLIKKPFYDYELKKKL